MTIYMIVAILPFCLIKANKDYNRSGICYTGTEIVNGVFCCDNYEAVNRKCRECEKGFESTKGDPCKTCAANFHGTGCVNSCECKNWESCDPVKGCVNMSTVVNQDVLTSFSTCSTSQQMKNDENDSRDELVRDTTIKPVLVYLFTSALLTFILTTTAIIMKFRKRRYSDSLTHDSASRITHPQIQILQNDQYTTIA